MANFEARQILIDQGASCDITFNNLFRTLDVSEDDMTTYRGCDLTGFNGSTDRPWRFATLRVTFEEGNVRKTVKCQFLIIDCPSPYNCIIARTTLVELGAISSTVHVKRRYQNHQDEVVTVHGDVEAIMECYLAGSKEFKDRKAKEQREKLPQIKKLQVNSVDSLARTT